MNNENALSNIIIREAIGIHKKLGPGLLESVYLNCLYDRLLGCGLKVKKELSIPLFFEKRKMECGFRKVKWCTVTFSQRADKKDQET